ncbi:MAG: FkbM family methyltransferase [Verrucomicrobia bacterium]|nr:FkbM family methyltransferase [Verrucomicrobiota bacterium]
MRTIREIGEHSVWTPGLASGGCVIDAGANHGRFTLEVMQQFPVQVVAIEANPGLAAILRAAKLRVAECALGVVNGKAAFHLGENDESSSVRKPRVEGSHLKVKKTVVVEVKTLLAIIAEEKLSGIACVKLDIEGMEVEVLPAIAPVAREISPQWTVEFHDEPEFGLCSKEEVDAAIRSMQEKGFSVLVRNWPARTNVLFLDRRQLGISRLVRFWVKWRYQWCAFLWRKLRGI